MDRLEEIRNRYDLIADGADPDMIWLISEVERWKQTAWDFKNDFVECVNLRTKAKARIKELEEQVENYENAAMESGERW